MIKGNANRFPIFCLLLGLSCDLVAASWNSLNGPYGGGVYPIFVNPNDQVYACFSGGLYTSSDLRKWTVVLNDCRSFKMGGDGRLYAENSQGLFSSGDWGASWSPLPKTRSDLTLERLTATADALYFAAGHEVLVSRDGAATWSVLGSFLGTAQQVVVDPTGVLFVYGGSRVYRSVDGLSWQQVFDAGAAIQDFNAQDRNALLLSAGDAASGTIYRSTDRGLSWTAAGLPYAKRLFRKGGKLFGAFGKPASPTNGASFISSDGGSSWRTVDVGLPIYAFDSDSQGRLLAASADGIWLSNDGGVTFSIAGPPASEVVGSASVGGNLFAATRTTVGRLRFWSLRAGTAVWSEIDKKTTLGEPNRLINLQVLPGGRLWMMLGFASGSDPSILFESRDAGLTWTVKRRSASEQSNFAFDTSIGAAYAWDAGGKVVYRTNDYGATWVPAALPFTVLAVLPAGNGVLYGFSGSITERPTTLVRSFNNGGAWEPQLNIAEPEGHVSSFAANLFSDLFKVTAKQNGDGSYSLVSIQRSLNCGETFQNITPQGFEGVSLSDAPKIICGPYGRLFLHTSAIVLTSADNGDTWEMLYEASSNRPARSLNVESEALFLGTAGTGLLKQNRLPTLLTPRPVAGLEYPLVSTYGVFWTDYDGDGDDDLFLLNEGSNELFRNQNGVLTRMGSGEIVSDVEPSRAGSWGDYNNDGFPDLYVCNGNSRNSLYTNNGDGTFRKRTLGNIVADLGNFRGCAWGDVNGDGFLDLYLARVDGVNILYLNNGDGGFVKSDALLIGTAADKSYGCAWCDFDNDGDLDLYVCNDGPDQLWEQVTPMKFSLVSSERLPRNTGLAVGCSWADVNNDGRMDLLVTNADAPNRLYLNNGDGSFRTATGPIAVDIAKSKGSGFADIDNDGDLDLLISANGTFLFYRNNNGVFERENAYDFCYFGGNSLSLAWADFDNDGDQDAVISSFDRKTVLYKNIGNANNWLKVKCVGTKCNRQAIGAKVQVKAVINGRPMLQTREISAQSGWLAQGSLVQHFGLGDAAFADSITVIWPGGKRQSMGRTAAGQVVTIVETDGQRVDGEESAPRVFRLLGNYPNPFNQATTIAFEAPEGAEVTAEIFSLDGRLLCTLRRPGATEGKILWAGCTADGTACASGVYLIRVRAGENAHTLKATLLR